MRDFVHGKTFSTFIIAVILLNAVVIGIETYFHSPVLKLIDTVCLWIFVAEIVLKLRYAASPSAWARDPWNIFDLVIVLSAFVPATGHMTTVLRILRVLRVVRLVKLLPELRLIVSVLGRSVVSMTYIAALMMIMIYVYAVVGVKLFGARQPEFASLHEAFFTLFRCLTVDDWTPLRYAAIAEHGFSPWLVTLYHVSWIMVSTFVMLNLIVGAIINNYHEVQEAEKRRNDPTPGVTDPGERMAELVAEMGRLLEEQRRQELARRT